MKPWLQRSQALTHSSNAGGSTEPPPSTKKPLNFTAEGKEGKTGLTDLLIPLGLRV